jgi:hypothetical protein
MNTLLIALIFAASLSGAHDPAKDALSEQNRILNETNDSLVRANSALRDESPSATAAAIEATKDAADRAAKATAANRQLLTAAKTELAAQMRTQTTSIILWNIAILVVLLSVAGMFVYFDHNRVQLKHSGEFRELLAAIQNADISSRLESQKATSARAMLASDMKDARALNEEQIVASNHVNEKISLGKAEVEKKIDKIEITTDASKSMLEEMREQR